MRGSCALVDQLSQNIHLDRVACCLDRAFGRAVRVEAERCAAGGIGGAPDRRAGQDLGQLGIKGAVSSVCM